MNNIFKSTYFGKPYKTRDGRKAIYVVYDKALDLNEYHYLIVEGEPCLNAYDNNGRAVNRNKSNLAIISEWQEPIGEEKLNEIAIKNCPYHDNDNLETAYFMGFKAGADYKHNSEMKKLKSVLNSLMIDTRDKAAIISLMEGKQ